MLSIFFLNTCYKVHVGNKTKISDYALSTVQKHLGRYLRHKRLITASSTAAATNTGATSLMRVKVYHPDSFNWVRCERLRTLWHSVAPNVLLTTAPAGASATSAGMATSVPPSTGGRPSAIFRSRLFS